MLRKVDPRFESAGLEFALRDDLPMGWRHPVTGRRTRPEDPALERLGLYLRRARYIAGRSQESVANEAGLNQGVISKLERALSPAMNVERLAWIEDAMHGAFPVGYCPHEHVCQWRRLKPRLSAEEEWERELAKQEKLTRRWERLGVSAVTSMVQAEPEATEESGHAELTDDEFLDQMLRDL